MTTISSLRRAGLRTWLPALLFALVVCLSVFTTWNTSLYCLDGDASSELVLAHHLNETGQILSQDWYYSTELRVLNTQLVYAPLFSIFSDWTMVRFAGAMILQALLVLSFLYLCRQANLSWGAFFLGASLLLLPLSVTYGRNVLYQTFYIPHIAIGFLLVSLLLSALRHSKERRFPRFIYSSLALMLLSFLSGLGGIRQLIITHGPLMLALLLLVYLDARDTPFLQALQTHATGILLTGTAVFFFLLGYIVNIKFLANRFVYSDYHNLILKLTDTEKLLDALFSILNFFGFRENIRALSLLGVFSASSVFSLLCCAQSSLSFLHPKHSAASADRRLLGLLPLLAVSVILCVFLFVDFSGIYTLYMVPAIVWIIPLLAMQYDALPQQIACIRRENVSLLLCVLFLAGNGMINSAYFSTNGRLFAQKYDGQWHEDMSTARTLEQPVAFLLENGYDAGYAEFWYANPVTEISNGEIRMVNVLVNQYGRPLICHEWLMLRETPALQSDKAFLLLTSYHDRAYATMPYPYKGERVYDDGNYVIYHFDDPSVIRDYTSWEYVLP